MLFRSGDTKALLQLAADVPGADAPAPGADAPAPAGAPVEPGAAWEVGLWRPMSSAERLVSLQAGWPHVVSALELAAGDAVELQPDGRDAGTGTPRLLLNVQRACGRAAVEARASPAPAV